MQHVAEDHPHARDECVALLTRPLEAAEEGDPSLNGFLVAYLLDLEAVESAPVIERAFADGTSMRRSPATGSRCATSLGLGPPPPPRKPWIAPPPSTSPPLIGDVPRPSPEQKAKAKARRKQEKKLRKQNRKRR